MFTKAIVRIPGKSLIHGLSDSKSLGLPNYDEAITQHKLYIEAFNKDYSLKSSVYTGGVKQVKNTLPRPVKQCRYNPNIP